MINKDKNEIIIRVENVKKKFGRKVILNNISFNVSEGEIFGIIGMSGAGKTTLLNQLIGYYSIDGGKIIVNTRFLRGKRYKEKFMNIEKLYSRIGTSFGFASQIPSFYPDLTIEENLKYFGSIYNVPRKILKKNIDRLLYFFSLSDVRKKRAKNLSGGMQKRLDIACGLIHNPKVIILDEPTADLDPLLREHTWNFIRMINKSGTTVLVASHFINDLSNLCDRVVMLHKGKVIKEGKPTEIIEGFTLYYEITLRLLSQRYDFLIKELLKYDRDMRYEIKNKMLYIYTLHPMRITAHITKLVKEDSIIDLDIKKPSLKEVFEVLAKE